MSTDRIRAASVRDGTALVASMGLVMLVASTSFLVSTVLVSDFQAQGRRADSAALLVTAESAANQAYDFYQRNILDPTVIPTLGGAPANHDDLIFPGGAKINGMTVSTKLTMLDDPKPGQWGDETFLLEAKAICGDKSRPESYAGRVVQMLIKPQQQNFFTKGALANGGYDWMGSASTDSYDSSLAPYAVPPGQSYANSHGDIASNGQLNVNNSGVHGSYTSFANIFLPQLSYNPPAAAPTVPAGGSITASYTFKNPGTFHTGSINIGKGDILRIEGGGTVTLYVDNEVYFNGAQLQFDNTKSTLIVYQNDYATGTGSGFKLNGNTNFGDIVPTAGGAVTQQSRPQQFQWYSMFQGSMDVNGTAQISCVLYAPSATVKANGTFDWMGAIVVNSFFTATGQGKVNGNFKFHYDESLSALTPNLNPRLQVAGWYTRVLAYGELP